MHDVARDSNAYSPLIVPAAAGRARVRVRRPRPPLAFSGHGNSAHKLPERTYRPGAARTTPCWPAGDVPPSRSSSEACRTTSPAVFPPRSRATPRTTTLVPAGSDELVASPELKGRRRIPAHAQARAAYRAASNAAEADTGLDTGERAYLTVVSSPVDPARWWPQVTSGGVPAPGATAVTSSLPRTPRM